MGSLIFTWAALLLALFQGAGQHDGFVTDRAGVLSAEQERALEAQIEAYRAGTTNEIAVLILPDLGGQALESISLDALRRWKVGTEEAGNGVVLLVSIQDRKIRIEVGSGLEGDLTDAKSGLIIRDIMAPRFRANDPYGAIRDGVAAIQSVLGGEALQVASKRQSSPFSGLISLVAILVVMALISRSRGGRGGRGGLGGLTGPAMGWMLANSVRGGGFGGGGGGGGFGGFGGGGRGGGGGASGGW